MAALCRGTPGAHPPRSPPSLPPTLDESGGVGVRDCCMERAGFTETARFAPGTRWAPPAEPATRQEGSRRARWAPSGPPTSCPGVPSVWWHAGERQHGEGVVAATRQTGHRCASRDLGSRGARRPERLATPTCQRGPRLTGTGAAPSSYGRCEMRRSFPDVSRTEPRAQAVVDGR